MSAESPEFDRNLLTFEQAEGAEPLPSQLQLKELSQKLRALLWQLVYNSISREFFDGVSCGTKWDSILYNYHVMNKHLPADEFIGVEATIPYLKRIILKGDYISVFGFLQWVIRHKEVPDGFASALELILVQCGAAYRIMDQRTIFPLASEHEGAALQLAFSDLSHSEFRGARSHLIAAGTKLTEGDYASSVRESIHAVEFVARILAPTGKLSEALAELERSVAIHGGLKKGFTAIYGYTSDEKGIRHPLIDEAESKVDEADALFMIGACASFVSYIIQKARLAGLLAE